MGHVCFGFSDGTYDAVSVHILQIWEKNQRSEQVRLGIVTSAWLG